MNPVLRAGIAKSDITTEAKDAIIKDPLYAKVLFLEQDTKRIAIITMDAVAIGGICDIGDDFLPKLRQRIETELGIPGPHVLVNASHTHPPGRILCDDEKLLEKTFDAVRRAAENPVEVLVGSVIAQEHRITMNRNLLLKSGRHWTIRHTNPSPPDEEIADIGNIDPDIGIIRIDRTDGTPFAVIYNFACHLLFADPQGSVSANIPGITSKIIEEHWGKETMALFLQGAAGDVIDVDFKNFHKCRNIEPFGSLLALTILKKLREITPNHSKLNIISEEVQFPRRKDIDEKIQMLIKEQESLLHSLRYTSLNFKNFLLLYLKYALHPDFPSDDSYQYLRMQKLEDSTLDEMDSFNRKNIQKYLENIHAMEKLSQIQDEIITYQRHDLINKESGQQTVTAQIQGIRIGECILISAPLEILTGVGLDIKKSSPYAHTLLAAFSNGYLHYGPPASDYNMGGYEVVECFLAPEWEEVFKNTARKILQTI